MVMSMRIHNSKLEPKSPELRRQKALVRTSTIWNFLAKKEVSFWFRTQEPNRASLELPQTVAVAVAAADMAAKPELPISEALIPNLTAQRSDSYHNYNLNYVSIAEVDATPTFTNFLPSVPNVMGQLKFVNNQFCTISEYTITGSTSQEKDQRKELVASTENEVQEYCDGLLQQIVDSSSATISTTYGDQKRSDNICGKRIVLGFDLNKTPEQKAPQKRKHRPKTDVIDEIVDSAVSTKKSCWRALNFDLEHTKYESQSKIGSHQEIPHTNKKALNNNSDHKATEMLGGATIIYDTNSTLLISLCNELKTENLPKNTVDNQLLHKKQTDNFQSERKSVTALSAITEEPQIAKFPVTEEVPAQGNSDLSQEG
ncbi:hypothetical protein LR48_Vigan02g180000 [Vigna angularis]|uniref:Uncharacterized protein n=1 Tax=Phaseolus angularis TaxID=3914 RepID=A0A0L9TYN1_PHAAN|nr:hypothetical protein LR48_Vigan02g180000 [Vigna angularis]